MKVISQGNVFSIHSDLMQTHNSLPPDIYFIRYSQEKGYYLLKRSDIDTNESKIYGVHHQKCDKILSAFELFDRNLGVILSGDKGIGKSLFARLLSSKAIKKGMPVLIIDWCTRGLGDFIESIKQECVVLFDEFDKTFNDDSQNELLSLLDGLTGGKKLFVVTCNSLSKLSEFMVNRPGRFHYHLRFEYPGAMEVREYLEDKLPRQYHNEIKEVVVFSRKVKLNYDCLRAIAFELSTGLSFQEAIKDLNILNVGNKSYRAALMYEDGTFLLADDLDEINLFDKSKRETIWLSDDNERCIATVTFSIGDLAWDDRVQALGVPVEKIKITYQDPSSGRSRYRLFDDDDEEDKEIKLKLLDEYAKRVPAVFTIEHKYGSNPHY